MKLRSRLYVSILSACLEKEQAFAALYALAKPAGFNVTKPGFYQYLYRLMDAGYLIAVPLNADTKNNVHKNTEHLYKTTPEGFRWAVQQLKRKL